MCSGKTGAKCTAKNIRAEQAELAFREVLLNAVKADYFFAESRDQQMKARQLEGEIDAVQKRREKLLALLNADPMEEVVTALKKANAELSALKEQKEALDQASAQLTDLSRSREAILSKIDLSTNPLRMEANMVLRRLGIKVEIGRYDPQIRYVVSQNGKRTLTVYQREDKIETAPYSIETAMRMLERGEIAEHQLEVNVGFQSRKAKSEEQTTIVET